MKLFNAQSFKRNVGFAIDLTATTYTDRNNQTYQITSTTEKGFFLSTKELPPPGTGIRSETNEVYIVANPIQEAFSYQCNLLHCPLLAEIFRNDQNARDTFGRVIPTSADPIGTEHCFIDSESTKTQFGADRPATTTELVLGFPVDTDIKSGDQLDIRGTQYHVQAATNTPTGVLRVVAKLTD